VAARVLKHPDQSIYRRGSELRRQASLTAVRLPFALVFSVTNGALRRENNTGGMEAALAALP
jgi:hypothetical protein